MITTLFLGFVVLMAAVVVALSALYLNGRTAFVITAGLFVWLIYVGLLGYFGVVRNAALRPPGIAFIFVPVLVFLVLSILGLRSSAGASLTDERRDARRVYSPRSIQPDPRRSSQSDDRNVSIHVRSRILRAVGGGAARACRASYRFNY
jgi:hypothetical protein